MSTYATVFYQHKNGLYSGFVVKYDGYIEGVGQMLYKYWDNPKDIRKLCTMKRYDMRELGRDFYELDWFSERPNDYLDFKNLTFSQVRKLKYYYGYCYIFKNNEWYVLRRNYRYRTLYSMLYED